MTFEYITFRSRNPVLNLLILKFLTTDAKKTWKEIADAIGTSPMQVYRVFTTRIVPISSQTTVLIYPEHVGLMHYVYEIQLPEDIPLEQKINFAEVLAKNPFVRQLYETTKNSFIVHVVGEQADIIEFDNFLHNYFKKEIKIKKKSPLRTLKLVNPIPEPVIDRAIQQWRSLPQGDEDEEPID